ncbi:imidazolonepropionase-like amidohydrolase [Flavobacteriaceae bacterium MAR_2010_105]|nr:imidazolonepropionase-like amidohydrolase [Flavobacteriaceae bacterium MAR_2010_105]
MRLITFLICVCLASCSTKQSEHFDLILSKINLIDGTGNPIQYEVNIYIKGNKIVKIEKGQIEGTANVIDGTDKYLIPGLFDCHTHTADYIEDFPRFTHYGVTSILVTGGSKCTNDFYAEMRAMDNQDSLPAPRVFNTSQHFTMEGKHPVKTYTSNDWIDGQTVFLLKDTLQIKTIVNQVAQYPIVGIKLTIEDGPFPPFVDRMPQDFVNKVVQEAAKNGLEVFVHASDNVEMAMAQQAGVKNYLHYVMIDLDWEKDATIIDGLVKNNASIVTTLMLKKSWLYPLRPDWLERLEQTKIYDLEEIAYLMNPARKGKALGILKARKFMTDDKAPTLLRMITPQMEDLKLLNDNGLNITLGTDTGNDFILPGISLHEEMQIMELGGFTPMEIIKMSTHNAAKMLHQLDDLGTIEVGKYADMILLDHNPLDSIINTLSINKVIKNGRIQRRMN